MVAYTREEPFFSLCGLNCCLCPRLNTEGASKCPGCGGADFNEKHPTCAVITCSKKRGSFQYCFECNDYPCKKYQKPSAVDSFISYKNVLTDMQKAESNLYDYLKELRQKYEFLQILLTNYNDGRSKGFYCQALNLLPLCEITKIMTSIQKDKKLQELSIKDRVNQIVNMFKDKSNELKIDITLRK